jgi:hypothetical protein
MHLKNRFFSVLTILFICAILATVQVKGQFFFPSIEALKNHHVKSMKVFQKPLYFKGGSAKELKALQFDSSSAQTSCQQIFYFNDLGYVDSTVYYPTESGFGQKAIYTYDGFSIVAHKSISNVGEVTDEWLLQQTENQEFISRSWENSDLRTMIKANADSVITASLFYVGSDTNWTRAVMFDPETDTKIEHWKGENGEFKIETYQWFTSNGQLISFRHTLEQKEAGKSKVIQKEKVYDLDSAGNVVNKYLGRFDDPYLQYNFYDRFEKIKPFTFNEHSLFRKNELFKEIEVSTPYTFSGIELVYLYTLEYEYW